MVGLSHFGIEELSPDRGSGLPVISVGNSGSKGKIAGTNVRIGRPYNSTKDGSRKSSPHRARITSEESNGFQSRPNFGTTRLLPLLRKFSYRPAALKSKVR